MSELEQNTAVEEAVKDPQVSQDEKKTEQAVPYYRFQELVKERNELKSQVQEVATAPSSSSQYFPRNYGYGWYQNNGNIYDAGTNVVASGSSYTSGDVLAIALDLDNQEVKFY